MIVAGLELRSLTLAAVFKAAAPPHAAARSLLGLRPNRKPHSVSGVLVLLLALLLVAKTVSETGALESSDSSSQADEGDSQSHDVPTKVERNIPDVSFGREKLEKEMEGEEREGRWEPNPDLNLLDLEMAGAQDLREVLEDRDIPDLIFSANPELETAFKEVLPEGTFLLFACSWDAEEGEVDVNMKSGKFLGISNGAIAFEVTTAEDDALFIMKIGLIDKSKKNNNPDRASLRFIKTEAVLSTLLPDESPEMLLTRGLVAPLAVGRLKNFPDGFFLNDDFDSTNTVALYPMVACNLRYLIDNELLQTLETKMYFTVRLLSLLAWLHSHGVVHLDLRPENMLVTADGHGFLAGFEKSAATDMTVKIEPLPGYVAPEMLPLRRRNLPSSNWHVTALEMDAWSAGYTIYRLWCSGSALDVNESNLMQKYRSNWGKRWDYSSCGKIPSVIVSLIDGLLTWEHTRRLLPAEIFEDRLLNGDLW